MAGITRFDARINRRRLLAASGGIALGASFLGRGIPALAQDQVIATLVTDTAGIGDQNFNDLANAGGERAAEELRSAIDRERARVRAGPFRTSAV